MGIIQRLFRGRDKRQGTGLEQMRWRQAPPRRDTSALLAAYGEIPRLATIIDVVGDAVADVEWRVLERRDKAGAPRRDYQLRNAGADRRWERARELADADELATIADHDMLGLLGDPNEFLTGRDVIKLICAHLDLVGEAFLVVEDVDGYPVSLWPVPPDLVTHLPDLSQPKEDRSYRMLVGGRQFAIAPDLVIPIKRVDPSNPLGRGVGLARSLGDELDTDEYAARFTKNSFFNDALPGAVVAVEGFNEGSAPAARAFKESLRQEYGGPDKAGRVWITSGKTTISRLDTPFRDMQLVELRKFLNDFTRMTYRVPPEVIGDVTSSNKATSYAAREHLAEQVTKPRAELIRAALQKHLAPRFGGEPILDYASPVPADREHRLRVMGTLPEAFSYDEWRAEAGCKPDANRQGYPLPLPGQQQGGQQTPAPEEGGAAEASADE